MELKVIAFDLDDTLYPERMYVLSGFQAVSIWIEAEWGKPAAEVYRELETYFRNGVRGDTFNRWLEAHALMTNGNLHKMVEVYRDHLPHLKPYSDVLPSLNSLSGRFSLALITEGYRKVQGRKIDALGIRELFGFIHIGGEEERDNWKPNPYPFRKLCDHFSVRPSQAMYIGDNPAKDFHGARKLGMSTVRMLREDGLHRQVKAMDESYEADINVRDMAEFESTILSDKD